MFEEYNNNFDLDIDDWSLDIQEYINTDLPDETGGEE